MAKRKKLNRRVVVLLSVIGGLLGVLVVTGIILTRPKDPHAMARQAAALLEQQQYAEAVRLYNLAANDAHDPKYMLACAQAMLEYQANDRSLGQSQRRALFRGAHTHLTEAMRLKPDFLEAQRQLTQMEFLSAAAGGDWKRYISSADGLIALDPKDHETIYRRAQAKARVAVSIPDYVEPALEDFRAAIALVPDSEAYRLGLASFLVQRKRNAEAETAYKEAIEAIPSSMTVRVALAVFYESQKRETEALALLQEAIKAQPDKADGYLALSSYYRRHEDLDKAVEVLTQAAQADPGDYRSFSGLAVIHMARRKPAEAEAELIRGLAAVEKAVGGDASQLEGGELGKYRTAVMMLNHQLCDVLLDSLGADGKREEVLPRVQAALSKMRGIWSESPFVTKIEGRVALVEGNLIQAEQLLRKAYDGFLPGFESRTAELLINLYRQLKQSGEAEHIVNDYLARRPESPSGRLALARLQVDFRNYDRAMRLVESVLKEEPDNEQAVSLQGVLQVLTGKLDRLPESVKELGQTERAALMARAQELWLANDQPRALQLVTEVVKRQPDDFLALSQLIRWYRSRSEPEKANAVYEHAKKAFQDNPAALSQLELLMELDPAKRLAIQLAAAARERDPVLRDLRTADVYLAFKVEQEYLKHLRAAEAKDPRNGGVVERLFTYSLSKQDWASAEKYAALAAETDLDKVGGRLYQARLARARGDVEGSIRLMVEALRLRPRFSLGHSFLGGCYMATNRLELAKESYLTAHEQDPSNFQALLGLLNVAQKEGNAEDYAHWVGRAYKFAYNVPEIQERYLQLREEKDRPEDVIRQREQRRKSEGGREDVTNLVRLGALYERTGQLAKAQEVYLDVQRITRNSSLSVRLLTSLLYRMDEDVRAQQILEAHVRSAKEKVNAHLLWAEYLERAGDYEKARLLFDKAIEADPQNAQGHWAAARFESRRADWAKAVAHQRQCLAVAGKDASSAMERELITYLIEDQKFQEAEQRIGKAMEQEPDETGWLSLKGLAHFRKGEYDQARDVFDRVLSREASNTRALIYRAQIHYARGDLSRATADLERARQTSAAPVVVLQLAGLYESIGDFENAYGVLQSLLSERPGYEPALRQMIELCRRNQRWDKALEALAEARRLYPREIHYVRAEAEVLHQLNQPQRAVAMLAEARKNLPQTAEIGVLLMRALIQGKAYDQALLIGKDLYDQMEVGPLAVALGGHAWLKKNDAAKAEKLFSTALAGASSGPPLSFVVGQVVTAYEGDEKQAAAKLKQWVSLRPKDWHIRVLVGGRLLDQGDYSGAETLLEEGLSLTGNSWARLQVLRQLALAYMQLRQFDKARATYEAALKLSPRELVMLNNLAWLLVAELKDAEAALPYAQRAVQVAPRSAHTLDTYGLVLMRLNRHREAEEVFRRGLDTEELAATWFNLGQLYEQTGRKDQAVRAYRAGLRLAEKDPRSPYRQRLLDALKRLGD